MQAENLASEENFSRRLQQAMDAAGITQAKLAERTGLTAPYLSELRKGRKSNPSGEVASKLARALGVSREWLVDGAGEAGRVADGPIRYSESRYDPPAGEHDPIIPKDAVVPMMLSAVHQLETAKDANLRLALAAHLQRLARQLEDVEIRRIAAGHPDAF